MHLGKGAALEKGQCLLKFFLRLAGEADDEIGGEGGAVEVSAEQPDGFQEALRRILPLHPGQDRVAAALQGEVEVGAEVGQGRQAGAEIFRDCARLQGAEADPHLRHGMAHGLDEAGQVRPAGQIPAVGRKLDAGDDQLPIPLPGQALGLLRRLVGGERAHGPAGVGDDAVGAEIGAAVLHL